MKGREIYNKTYKLLTAIIICLGIILFILLFFYYSNKKINGNVISKKADYRAIYHFTTPDKWKNDPQRPIFFDHRYHYYYLYNRDYPKGNGTEWRQATSEDLIHWKDEGVAIPKYTNKNGDIWSGSVIVDDNNTAGFGKGALVAIITQPSANGGRQEQYLWYSIDKGKTFKAYGDSPIIQNHGIKDFGDPKIIWESHTDKWVMALAEGTKIGFYDSHNLKDWHYTGDFMTRNIGITECPDLFMMRANDGVNKWILGVSANGKSEGNPNTYAYWVGNYDGKKFITDEIEPQWLDYGFDWYAAVTFENSRGIDKFTKRYAFAWMNNWDYPDNTPTMQDGFNGTDSIVRQISLKKQGDDIYSLISQPIEIPSSLIKSTDHFRKIAVTGSKTLKIYGESYQLDADISWFDAGNVGFRLRESADKKHHIDVGISIKDKYSYVNRSFTGQPDKRNKFLECRAPFDSGKKKVHLRVLIDKTSIEVFVDDGKVTYSNEVFPNLNDKGITLFSIGGKAMFQNMVIKHFGL